MKKITSIVLCLLMIVGIVSALPVFAGADAAAWDGSVATGFEGGTGTATDPYLIANGAQLAYMAKQINSGASNGAFRTANYKLTADIVLNEGDAADWATTAPANVFTPIGIADNGTDDTSWRAGGFNGSFNGNGKTISGVYVVNETSASKNAGTGLFAILGDSAKVRNFAVVNSYISANKAAGVIGLALTSNNLSIESIFSSAIVHATESGAGGVVGQLSGNGGGRISGCAFAGTVTSATSIAGGILGNGNGKKIAVSDCLFAGTATASSYASGIVGRNDSPDCTVTRCISAGTTNYHFVASKNAITDATITNCYYVGNLSSKNCVAENCVQLESIGAVIGTEIDATITAALANWSVRNGDIMVPTGVVAFAPMVFRMVYTVTWVNEDGAVLATEEYEIGATPEYKGETLTKAEDDTYTYTFSNWSPVIAPVSCDVTYTAEFFKTRKNVVIEEETEPATEPVVTEAPATETEPVEEKGCGSVIGYGATVLVAIIGAAAAVATKKKED